MKDLRGKISYLQGLAEGLELENTSREGRILNNIIDVLGDFAESLNEMQSNQAELESYLETIDQDLLNLEDEVYEYNSEDEAEEYVEVECPNCNEKVYFESDILEDEDMIEVTCPNCDEVVFINDDTYEYIEEDDPIENKRDNEDI